MVEVNIVVILGLARGQILFGGIGIAKLLVKAAYCVCSDGYFHLPFGGSFVQNARFGNLTRNPLRRSCVSSAGKNAIYPINAQSSTEIVRVKCAKCRRGCDLSGARATLSGNRARSAGENAICPVPAQASAEIARVEHAKCRRILATLVCGTSKELKNKNR